MDINFDLKGLTRNITITFSPSLKSQLPEKFTLNAETLIKKHLNITYKNAQGEEASLTILAQDLTHFDDRSELTVEFLEKLRPKKTEAVTIKISDP